jgi:hypothetical protein
MKARGWRYFLTGSNHLGFEHEASGTRLHTSNTPSDHRSWRNFIARVKRIERSIAAGA